MTWLFNWLVHQLYQIAGYIAGIFLTLYNYIYQVVLYCLGTLISWLEYILSVTVIICVYTLDIFLQSLIYFIRITIGGDLFGLVGLSSNLIETNLQSILTLAPYGYLVAYVLNLDALYTAFNAFLTFLLVWLVYRWIRVWVRG